MAVKSLPIFLQTICVPFAWNHKAVDTKALTVPGTWEGVIEIYNVGVYIENYLLIVIGGIPWQVIKCFIFFFFFNSTSDDFCDFNLLNLSCRFIFSVSLPVEHQNRPRRFHIWLDLELSCWRLHPYAWES